MKKFTKYIFLLLAAALIAFVGYGIDRVELTYFQSDWEFPAFIGAMFVLFAGYFFLIWKKGWHFSLKEIILSAIVLRVVLAGMVPNLSDDYFRFTWDGRIMSSGNNPYTVLPDSFIVEEATLAEELQLTGPVYEGLNSKIYYTVYPPVNQLCFATAAIIAGNNLYGNVLVLRLLIFLGEIGTLLLLLLLLRHFDLPDWQVLIYALNPLVVLELTGNLHFEGMMLGAFLLSVLLLIRNKWVGAAFAFGAAIGIKLIPLMFMPLLIKRLGWKKVILFGLTVAAVVAAMFAPFINRELIDNFGSSLDLYFRNFEFNASFYYFFRAIGEALTDFNLIKYIGPGMALMVLVAILTMSFKAKSNNWLQFMQQALLALSIYLFLSTTVHPWYIITLVGLSVFVPLRFALAWSAMALLSYYKYITGDYEEPYLFVAVEYLVVFGVLIYEFRKLKRESVVV